MNIIFKEGLKLLVKFEDWHEPILCEAHHEEFRGSFHWFLLQNTCNGTDCRNKKGYEYSWIINRKFKGIYNEESHRKYFGEGGAQIEWVKLAQKRNITIIFNQTK